jgi:hypothetical protein
MASISKDTLTSARQNHVKQSFVASTDAMPCHATDLTDEPVDRPAFDSFSARNGGGQTKMDMETDMTDRAFGS